MIHETDLFSLLNNKVPELRRDIHCLGEQGCPYKLTSYFAKFTSNLIRENQTQRLTECLSLAEEMLKNGNNTIKSAVENSYIFLISRGLRSKHLSDFPLVNEEFRKQVHARCI